MDTQTCAGREAEMWSIFCLCVRMYRQSPIFSLVTKNAKRVRLAKSINDAYQISSDYLETANIIMNVSNLLIQSVKNNMDKKVMTAESSQNNDTVLQTTQLVYGADMADNFW